MEIRKRIEDKVLYVELTEKLDTVTSQVLLDDLKDDIAQVEKIEFDFKELNYISSAGLRALLTYKKMLGAKDKVVVKNANEVIKNIFNVTGIINLITVL